MVSARLAHRYLGHNYFILVRLHYTLNLTECRRWHLVRLNRLGHKLHLSHSERPRSGRLRVDLELLDVPVPLRLGFEDNQAFLDLLDLLLVLDDMAGEFLLVASLVGQLIDGGHVFLDDWIFEDAALQQRVVGADAQVFADLTSIDVLEPIQAFQFAMATLIRCLIQVACRPLELEEVRFDQVI